MAIFHFHVDRTCRAKEQSPVAAAAYRSAQKLYGERDGITHNDPVAAAAYRSGENLRNEQQGKEHDYTRKHGVVHSEIMLPKHAPKEFKDRATLWNSADKAEKQWNAQTARQIDIALPVEFTLEEHIKNLREYVQENFVDEGMCADWNIHDNGDGNPHVHIQLTMRPLNEDGT